MCSRVGMRLVEAVPAPTENRTGIIELVVLTLTQVNRIGMRLTWRWPLVPAYYFVLEKLPPLELALADIVGVRVAHDA